MIISKDISPERDLYYLGGKVIELLSNSKNDDLSFFDIYENIKNNEDISLKLYTLTLDWLYILGIISKIENGKIIKCF